MQPVYSQTDKKSSRMVRGILTVLAIGVTVFLSFQAVVYSTTPRSDRAVWGSDEASIVASNNWFALNLYTGLRGQDDNNLFFSPFSISSALTMTMLGARGPTAEQMFEVLHFDQSLSREVLHSGFKALLRELLSKEEDHYILHLANRVYLQQGFPFLDSFKEATREYYKAESQNLDFRVNIEVARKVVNDWVEDMTKDKIKELLKPGILSEMTRFVLVNVIYFKGNWQNKFDAKLTKERTFYINETDGAKVDFMYQKGHFRNGYDHTLNAQILELPYLGKDLTLVLILPRDRTGLKSVQDQLTGDVTDLTKDLHNTTIEVYLPKFKMTCDFDLVELLRLMGMRDLMSGNADLSGMNGDKDLSVSHIIHKAFIDVNEEGSEAAAATAVIGIERAMVLNSFVADHPFYFFIKHEKTSSILFMGRYVHPPESVKKSDREDL